MGKLKERDCLKELDVDGRLISKLDFSEQKGRPWSVFILHGIEACSELMYTR